MYWVVFYFKKKNYFKKVWFHQKKSGFIWAGIPKQNN